ncbi:ABC transporter permease [Clostridium oryzae]|uniref:ABC-2 family transporter protein n=1 Tax=Clostridium oryzae TaxID=1450648 RepID=A0A1V4IJK5_9CLOT|nr:ABC transporter permease [Clostridium oryzae]OPJ60020.1 ABC-2 family transporter protein [Clostridium oryzae]
MNNLLKCEMYKLWHNRSFWVMLLFSIVLESLMILDSHVVALTSGLFYASLYNMPLLYLLITIFAALFVGEDFVNRTLHSFISAGHRRGAVMVAKMVTYLVASVLILLVPLIIDGFAGTFASLKFANVSAMKMLSDCLVVLFSILAMGMLPLLASFFFRDVGKTLLIPMIAFFLMIFILNGDSTKIFATILPMGQLRLLSVNQLPISNISVIGIDILWIVGMFAIAYIQFDKLDIK